MNIFWLDYDLEVCAQYHCDKHVVKMIVEYTQLLSSSSRLAGLEQGYKLSHSKHPDTLWLLESLSNWKVLRVLCRHLSKEYTRRYGKVHKSSIIMESLEEPPIKDIGVTKPPQCMPEIYKHSNPVVAYRNYYIGEKSRFANWKTRDIPCWFNYEGIFVKNEEGEPLTRDLTEVHQMEAVIKDCLMYCRNYVGSRQELKQKLFTREVYIKDNYVKLLDKYSSAERKELSLLYSELERHL